MTKNVDNVFSFIILSFILPITVTVLLKISSPYSVFRLCNIIVFFPGKEYFNYIEFIKNKIYVLYYMELLMLFWICVPIKIFPIAMHSPPSK